MSNILDTPITIFPKITQVSNPKHAVLSDLFEDLKDVEKFDNSLRLAYKESKEEYDSLKQKLPGFVLGKFSKRNDNSCDSYSNCLAFDIDKIADGNQLNEIMETVRKIKYVYAAFPSVSGHGLRLLVETRSTLDRHKEYYKSLLNYLKKELDLKGPAKLDTSTFNVSRIWLYSPLSQNELYINPNHAVYTIESPTPSVLSTDDKISIAEGIINARGIDGRNNYAMQFTRLASEFGISEGQVFSTLTKLISPGFDQEELSQVILRNFYKSDKRYSDQEISNLPKIINGNQNGKPKQYLDTQRQNKNQFIQIRDYIQNKYIIRQNEISFDVEVKQFAEDEFSVLNENDLICELMENNFRSVDNIIKRIINSSYVERYNPLKDYLNNLPNWDESKPDYITQLASYIDATDQKWFNSQFKKMIVRSLACSLGYIPFNKHCFTLVGNQNDGKTSFLRFLCPNPLKAYYTENIRLDKDGSISLAQNIFINLDEIATISYQDRNKIKSLLTTEFVKERLPYAPKTTRIPRIANFFASTNDSELLTDPTGNVRWLIFEIKKIKHDNGGPRGYSKNIDIDNVYSQAYHLLNSNFKYQLTADEIQRSESNNKNHMVTFEEYELIEKHYEEDNECIPANFKMATEILVELQEKYPKMKFSNARIGRALSMLGIQKLNGYTLKGKERRKGYYLKII